jgi:hypothetical protein
MFPIRSTRKGLALIVKVLSVLGTSRRDFGWTLARSARPSRCVVIIMTDKTAESARLMNVIDALVAELDRQGLTEALVNLGFDCTALAKEAIKAADGDVVRFPGGTL